MFLFVKKKTQREVFFIHVNVIVWKAVSIATLDFDHTIAE